MGLVVEWSTFVLGKIHQYFYPMTSAAVATDVRTFILE